MDEGRFDRLARQVVEAPSRRAVVGGGFAAAAAVLAAVGRVGVDGEAKKKKRKKKGPPALRDCDMRPKLCSSSDECCGGRVCAQNGCATNPDRPRCCAGVGQPCSGNDCECCGIDLKCTERKCVYAPNH